MIHFFLSQGVPATGPGTLATDLNTLSAFKSVGEGAQAGFSRLVLQSGGLAGSLGQTFLSPHEARLNAAGGQVGGAVSFAMANGGLSAFDGGEEGAQVLPLTVQPGVTPQGDAAEMIAKLTAAISRILSILESADATTGATKGPLTSFADILGRVVAAESPVALTEVRLNGQPVSAFVALIPQEAFAGGTAQTSIAQLTGAQTLKVTLSGAGGESQTIEVKLTGEAPAAGKDTLFATVLSDGYVAIVLPDAAPQVPVVQITPAAQSDVPMVFAEVEGGGVIEIPHAVAVALAQAAVAATRPEGAAPTAPLVSGSAQAAVASTPQANVPTQNVLPTTGTTTAPQPNAAIGGDAVPAPVSASASPQAVANVPSAAGPQPVSTALSTAGAQPVVSAAPAANAQPNAPVQSTQTPAAPSATPVTPANAQNAVADVAALSPTPRGKPEPMQAGQKITPIPATGATSQPVQTQAAEVLQPRAAETPAPVRPASPVSKGSTPQPEVRLTQQPAGESAPVVSAKPGQPVASDKTAPVATPPAGTITQAFATQTPATTATAPTTGQVAAVADGDAVQHSDQAVRVVAASAPVTATAPQKPNAPTSASTAQVSGSETSQPRPIFAAEAALILEKDKMLAPTALSGSSPVADKAAVMSKATAQAFTPGTPQGTAALPAQIAVIPAAPEDMPSFGMYPAADTTGYVSQSSSVAQNMEASATATADKPTAASRMGEAMISQIKSVQLEEGRTQIALKPGGLGQIEIVIQNAEDSASKIVVKVENPMVLNSLREDRQMLAAAIGVTDDSQLEFQSGEFDGQSQGENSDTSDFTGGGDVGITGDQPVVAETTIIQDSELDLVT